MGATVCDCNFSRTATIVFCMIPWKICAGKHLVGSLEICVVSYPFAGNVAKINLARRRLKPTLRRGRHFIGNASSTHGNSQRTTLLSGKHLFYPYIGG